MTRRHVTGVAHYKPTEGKQTAKWKLKDYFTQKIIIFKYSLCYLEFMKNKNIFLACLLGERRKFMLN